MLPGSNKYELQLGVCCWSDSRCLISCGTKEPSLPSPPPSVVLRAAEQKSSSPAPVQAATQREFTGICWHSPGGPPPLGGAHSCQKLYPGMRLQGLGRGSAAGLSPKSCAVCVSGVGGLVG